MAIDSSLWAADIPAGTYSVGDVIQLGCIDGPSNVRSGRGRAVLKNTFVAQAHNPPQTFWRIHIRNSDWIDEMVSFTSVFDAPTAFDPDAGLTQSGHDCDLTSNSSWQVYAECVVGGTSTNADSLFCLIDIDYPEVSAIQNPRVAVGIPTSIEDDVSITSHAYGAAMSSTWLTRNVDYFKAGYRYVLDAVECISSAVAVGFVAFSNAAGMGGLQRIIPIMTYPFSVRYPIKYSSALVKGPMDVKYKMFQLNAGTIQLSNIHDYVKRG